MYFYNSVRYFINYISIMTRKTKRIRNNTRKQIRRKQASKQATNQRTAPSHIGGYFNSDDETIGILGKSGTVKKLDTTTNQSIVVDFNANTTPQTLQVLPANIRPYFSVVSQYLHKETPDNKIMYIPLTQSAFNLENSTNTLSNLERTFVRVMCDKTGRIQTQYVCYFDKNTNTTKQQLSKLKEYDETELSSELEHIKNSFKIEALNYRSHPFVMKDDVTFYDVDSWNDTVEIKDCYSWTHRRDNIRNNLRKNAQRSAISTSTNSKGPRSSRKWLSFFPTNKPTLV